MKKYYNKRAAEYEKIYHRNDPIRQQEQKNIEKEMIKKLSGRSILEIACGTAYWTEKIAPFTDNIFAIDSSKETLEIAASKNLSKYVIFQQDDGYELNSVINKFNGGLANFWFSHIPKAKIFKFLENFHKKLEKGTVVFMADNMYVQDIGGELISNGKNDSFKVRTLDDGSKHKILKNYYTLSELKSIFSKVGSDLEIHTGKCFWWLSYTT